MPAGDPDHREMWDQINATSRELAEHTGACAERHREIIRRQDESIRDRHGMNLKLDAMKSELHTLGMNTSNAISAMQTKMLMLMLTVAGGVLIVVGTAILQFVLKK